MWLWASMAWAAEIRVTERGTGRPIADATVTIGDASYPVDADGRATTPDWAEVATVTVDAPGWQSTTVAAAPGARRVNETEEEKRVIRRPGLPSDVANMVLFLASEASAWITGQTYPVNGGFTFAL